MGTGSGYRPSLRPGLKSRVEHSAFAIAISYVVLVGILATAEPARACSCVDIYNEPEAAFDQSDFVFLGEVSSIAAVTLPVRMYSTESGEFVPWQSVQRRGVVTFRVKRDWKGDSPPTYAVLAGAPPEKPLSDDRILVDCEAHFEVGKTYLVFASGAIPEADPCMPTGEMETGDPVIEQLDRHAHQSAAPGSEARPAERDEVEASQRPDIPGIYRLCGIACFEIEIRANSSFTYRAYGDLEGETVSGSWRLTRDGVVIANSEREPPVPAPEPFGPAASTWTVRAVFEESEGLPGAQVTLKCGEEVLSALTDISGQATLPSCRDERPSLTVEFAGADPVSFHPDAAHGGYVVPIRFQHREFVDERWIILGKGLYIVGSGPFTRVEAP